jgi:signal transduction histidine kinase
MQSRNATALARGVARFALGPVELLVFAAHLIGLAVTLVGLAFVFQPVAEHTRWLADLGRRLAGRWSDRPIPTPYRPRPARPEPGPDGLYPSIDGRTFHTTPTRLRFHRWTDWIFHDPATWRDLAWYLLDPVVGGLLAVLPAGLVGAGVWLAVARPAGPLPLDLLGGLVLIAAGWLLAPALLDLHGRWSAVLLAPVSASALAGLRAVRRWLKSTGEAAGHCLALGVLSLLAWPVLLIYLIALAVGGRGLPAARWLPQVVRNQAAVMAGLAVGVAYDRAHPLRDPATRRDLVWLLTAPVVGLPALLPPVMIIYGIWGLIAQALFDPGRSNWVGELFGSLWLALDGGIALVLLGLLGAPALVRLALGWSTRLLRPTAGNAAPTRQQLAARVQELTRTRAAATDTQAAEVRRIERDLHDGAQARLVAMGLTLGAVEALIDSDPIAAKDLLARVRESSATALTELRGLVRGIHPPVLAERGLVDAIRALALDSPLRVRVEAELAGRPAEPVESAVYFAVAEALTNATRHGQATAVWIELRHERGTLRVTVTDDGVGGAEPGRGSGLRGIERRLGSFDGKLALSSPVGGPTTVTMELPCALSSPRISTSSETA